MTKQATITQLKIDYPSLTKQINDEIIQLDAAEYEATIDAWADAVMARAAKKVEAEAKAEAKAVAQAKLAALGLTVEDLQALGL